MALDIDKAPLSSKHVRRMQATFSALHTTCAVLMELAVAVCAGLVLSLGITLAGVPGGWPVKETGWVAVGALALTGTLWAMTRYFSSRLRAYSPAPNELSIALARARHDHEKVARYIDTFAPQLRPLTQMEARMLLSYKDSRRP